MREVKKIAEVMLEEIEEMIEDAKNVIEKEYSSTRSKRALRQLGEHLFENGVGTIFYVAGEAGSLDKSLDHASDKELFSRQRKRDSSMKTTTIDNYKSQLPEEMYEPHGVKESLPNLKAQIVQEVMKRLEKLGKEE